MNRRVVIEIGITIVASMLLIMSTTASAAKDRIVESQGKYVIDNPDGTKVVIDTDDIENNAEAIVSLNGQLGGLSFKYGTEKAMGISEDDSKGYYWSKDTSGNWVKIGAVGNAEPWMILSNDGTKDITFSSEHGVDIAGMMSNHAGQINKTTIFNNENHLALDIPATGYYDATSKLTTDVLFNPKGTVSTSLSALQSQNRSTNNGQVELASTLNLGINQSITIPAGYYSAPFTIANGVADKGSLNATVTGRSSLPVAAGYYAGGTIYGQGGGSITYTYHHHTTGGNANSTNGAAGPYPDGYASPVYGGCFTIPYYHFYKERTKCGHWDCTSRSGGRSYFKCSGCGATASHYDGGASQGWGMGSHYDPAETIDVWTTNSSAYDSSWITETRYLRSCGKSECQIVEAHIIY